MKLVKFLIVNVTVLFLLTGCDRQETALPQRRNLVDAVFASGTVIMEDTYHLTSQTVGILASSLVKEGDSVKSGQLLFRLENSAEQALESGASASYRYAESNVSKNSPVWQKLLLQEKQASSQLTTDSLQYVRYAKLYASHAVAKADMDKMKLAYENSRTNLNQIKSNMSDTHKSLQVDALNAQANYLVQKRGNDQTAFKAPYDGIVLSVSKSKGDLVKNGEMLAEIGSGRYLAKLMVSEDDISKVKLGQEVYIELNTEKGRSYKAQVTRIYPAFDNTEQSFVVEADFVGQRPSLREGTQLQANIVIATSKNALTIPRRFLETGNLVAVKGQADPVKVQVGIVTPEWVEIKAGLKETDKIIFRNNGKD